VLNLFKKRPNAQLIMQIIKRAGDGNDLLPTLAKAGWLRPLEPSVTLDSFWRAISLQGRSEMPAVDDPALISI
jgi:hypothetical protein